MALKDFQKLWPRIVAVDDAAVAEFWRENQKLLLKISGKFVSKGEELYGPSAQIDVDSVANYGFSESIRIGIRDGLTEEKAFVNLYFVCCRNRCTDLRRKDYPEIFKDSFSSVVPAPDGSEVTLGETIGSVGFSPADFVLLGEAIGKRASEVAEMAPHDIFLDAVEKVVSSISAPKMQTIVRMRFLEGKPVEEIVRATETKASTIGSTLSNFKEWLAVAYKEDDPLRILMEGLVARQVNDNRIALLHGDVILSGKGEATHANGGAKAPKEKKGKHTARAVDAGLKSKGTGRRVDS